MLGDWLARDVLRNVGPLNSVELLAEFCGMNGVRIFAENHFDHRGEEAAVLCESRFVLRCGGGFDGILRCGGEEFRAAYEDAVDGGGLRFDGERQNFFDE